MLAMSAAVVISVGWVVTRLDEFERQGGSNGVMAVIDKCGNAYDFAMTRSGEWQPDEALYFSALEDMIDCTRGLRAPQERGGRSCWLKVWPVLSKDATVKLTTEFLQPQLGKDMAKWPDAMKRRQIDVEILPGSTKSDDGRYRLAWKETERASGRVEYWSGVFAASRVVATKESVAAGNAIGLRIDSFTWQKDQVSGR